MRSDGFNFVQVQDVKVIGNSLKDFSPVSGDHADAIQFWTTGSTVASKNIEISNNLITGKSGGQMQGIFITDQSGGKLPYPNLVRSEEHTSELQSLMRISYAVFCLKKKK